VAETDGEDWPPGETASLTLQPDGNGDDPISRTDDNWKRSGWQGGATLRAALSVLRVETVIRQDATALLRPFQLSMPRHELLGNLYFSRLGEITLGKLSDLLMTHPTSVTGIVDGLEKLSLVARVAHPTDRRMTLVRITHEGRRRFEHATTVMAETKFSIDALSEEEAETVYRLLRKVLAAAAVNRSRRASFRQNPGGAPRSP
jgi:DNA-binding MarR family transcriptional regulator